MKDDHLNVSCAHSFEGCRTLLRLISCEYSCRLILPIPTDAFIFHLSLICIREGSPFSENVIIFKTGRCSIKYSGESVGRIWINQNFGGAARKNCFNS